MHFFFLVHFENFKKKSKMQNGKVTQIGGKILMNTNYLQNKDTATIVTGECLAIILLDSKQTCPIFGDSFIQ